MSAPARDWRDPEWAPDRLPSTDLVIILECCSACGAAFEDHCFEPCESWHVGCHRSHEGIDSGDVVAVCALPPMLGVQGFGARN